MKTRPTRIPDVVVVQPEVYGDERGFFFESWNRRDFAAGGLDVEFVQDNHSRSRRGTLRGLHYQVERPQGKLVRVVEGEIFDVAVDLRQDSATFGEWVGEWLSATDHRMLWIPPGFAHGFYVASDSASFLYKCSGHYYAPELERAIAWNDPDLAIEWPLPDGASPILSAKDSDATPFHSAEYFS